MHIVVLGAAAGGGFPQWNTNSDNCRRSRGGDPNARPQTQSSIAVSADGERWCLFNASPDLRQQIADNRQLHPKTGKRHSPIASVVLTNGDVDHVAGLLNLRESQPLALYGSRRVLQTLADNSIFNVLNPDFVARREFALDQPFALTTRDDEDIGLSVEAFAVPGKVALYLENPEAGANFGTQAEDTVGLRISERNSDAHFFHIPGCAAMTPELAERLRGAPLVMFDGTLWTDDEMVAGGVGVKTGQRMGHMSMSGPDGSIAAFDGLDVARRMFIHINNTNPVIVDDSPERADVEAAGWEVARDGMEIEL